MSDDRPNARHDQKTSKESGSYQRAPAFRDSALKFKERALAAAVVAQERGRQDATDEAARLAAEATRLAFSFERWLAEVVPAETRLASVNDLARLQDAVQTLEAGLA